MSLYIDLSEFFANPIRTGIQRISGELCRHLPSGAAVPVRLGHEGYLALSPELIRCIGRYFDDGSQGNLSEIQRRSTPDAGRPVHPDFQDIVLVPEVFDNPDRVSFFQRKSDRELMSYRFVVYDLLPMTHPKYFATGGTIPIFAYFKLLRRAPYCSFISAYTQDTYCRRLLRINERRGLVLPLGCDALGPRTAQPSYARGLDFTVLGTVEPRKNHRLILEAFLPMLNRVSGLTLTFIGKMGWVDGGFAEQVCKLSADPGSGFRWLPGLDDSAILNCIQRSRATIYVSVAEGYGLPPVESLWVGTPVIASNCVPSLERLGNAGVHVVEPADVMNLRRAVLAFCDDSYMREKIDQAASLNLPSWRSFTEDVLAWCAAG